MADTIKLCLFSYGYNKITSLNQIASFDTAENKLNVNNYQYTYDIQSNVGNDRHLGGNHENP